MAAQAPYRLPDELAQRWQKLAERRREYFVELYRSGRWRRYFSDGDFRTLIREVIEGVDAWDSVVKQNSEKLKSPVLRLRSSVRSAEKPRGEKAGQARRSPAGNGSGRRRASAKN